MNANTFIRAGLRTAKDREIIEIYLDVSGNENIEQSVTVKIEPECRRAERLPFAQATGVCDVDECALAAILEQAILPDARDQNVGEAVIVVVADCDAHAVHFNVQSRRARDVGESAVSVVVIELES